MSLINVQNLTFSYDGGIENVFEDVCFQIDTDWKLGFVGRNGRGKTTFLKLLAVSASSWINTALTHTLLDSMSSGITP